jgi:hypothetical protein
MFRQCLAGLVTSFAFLFCDLAYATTVTVTKADEWSGRRGGIADAQGGLVLTFKNNTGVDLIDFHIWSEGKQYTLVPGFGGSIAPFTMHSFTNKNNVMNMWGGKLDNGSMFSFRLAFLFNGQLAKDTVVAFRFKGTTDGKPSTEIPLPAALPALLAGLGSLVMFRRMTKRTA